MDMQIGQLMDNLGQSYYEKGSQLYLNSYVDRDHKNVIIVAVHG